MKKELVVNADDFGYTEGINDGICEAYDEGILTSVSVMVNGQAFEDALHRLEDRPGLGRGIHVTLSANSPLTDPDEVPSLVRADGSFYDEAGTVYRKLLLGGFDLDDLETEIRNQVREGMDAVPAVDHLDSHMHVHMIPSVYEIVGSIAAEFGIPAVRFSSESLALRASAPGNGPLFRSVLDRTVIKSAFVSILGRVVGERERTVTEGFAGIRHLGGWNERTLTAFLESNVESPVELCVHPGHYDPELEFIGEPLNEAREIDLGGLTDPGVVGLAESQYDLVRFSDLYRRGN